MSHIFVSHESIDRQFASQLASQLEQRGMKVWAVPDTGLPAAAATPTDESGALESATHVLAVLTPTSVATHDRHREWKHALKQHKHVILILRETCDIPDFVRDLPVVDFRRQYLLAVEDLVDYLKKTDVPTRPLTYELPAVNADLLPGSLPAERCWREFRLRVNYRLPVILSAEILMELLPGFYDRSGLQLVETNFRTTPPAIVAERAHKVFSLFDPRRAQHTVTIEPETGAVHVYYQTYRSQVWFWLPAHYHVLDCEAAALYRYLVTQELGDGLASVEQQARTAITLSWMTLIVTLVVAAGLLYLVAVEVLGLHLF